MTFDRAALYVVHQQHERCCYRHSESMSYRCTMLGRPPLNAALRDQSGSRHSGSSVVADTRRDGRERRIIVIAPNFCILVVLSLAVQRRCRLLTTRTTPVSG